ncbi:DUF1413 domain-containing protein [Sphingomonas sp. R86520]|uniref:DUF1413 domain-containing protein n=1 Tax=Sphingomonas sp. R86520 TaxID=3093859 RepID=UPI0036D2C882
MFELDDSELELAQNLINDCAAGQYEVEDIYREFWEAIPHRTTFGRRFKKAVIGGKLRGIRWMHRSSENHQVYELLG